MISVLVPSRGRPEPLRRLADSIVDTATGEVELVVRVDDDDRSYDEYFDGPLVGITVIDGPRVLLSELWNECYAEARGRIYMHCGDDIIMRTPGWDQIVTDAFPDDRIAFVHGDDGDPTHGAKFGTHGFLHQRWVDAVGYFLPPLFSSDWNDTWLNEVANAIGRRVHVPILTEHMHPAYGKAEYDATHLERIARHQADDCDRVYRETAHLRERDAEKLRAAMAFARLMT